MRRIISARAIAVLGLVVAEQRALAAQAPLDSAKPTPYSQLRLRVSGTRNVNHEPLHDYWRAGMGGSIALTTPFYVGSVGAGATLLPFKTRDTGRPNFRALLLGLDWGVEFPAPGPLRARGAARVGDFVMLVENPDVWLDSESELFFGAELSAALSVWKQVSVTAAGTFARVYTRPALDLAFISVGFEYATRTPGWLRAILE
jgi:hypothetical protein